MKHPFQDLAVEAAFASYPSELREPLLRVRDLSYEVADRTDGVGPLVETLKWSQTYELRKKAPRRPSRRPVA